MAIYTSLTRRNAASKRVQVTRDQLEALAFEQHTQIVISDDDGTARTRVGTTEYWCDLNVREVW